MAHASSLARQSGASGDGSRAAAGDPVDMKGRSLLTLEEFSAAEVDYLISSAISFKELKCKRVFPKNLRYSEFLPDIPETVDSDASIFLCRHRR